MSTVMIQAKNGRQHEIDIKFIAYSETLKMMLDVPYKIKSDQVITIPDVSDEILIQVIEWLIYCHYNSSSEKTPEIKEDLKQWKNQFLQQNSQILMELLKAANSLQIQTLVDATSKLLASRIVGKTSEAIREEFGIEDDLTIEQKEEISQENHLCGVPGY